MIKICQLCFYGVFTAVLSGCAGARPEVVEETNLLSLDSEPITENDAAEAESNPKAERTWLTRDEVDNILSKGPAYVLAMVQADAHVDNNQFVGFKVVSFRTEAPACLGVQPGDIVQKVNGNGIQRPEHFFKVFDQLKTANEISIQFIREGKVVTSSCLIVDALQQAELKN